VQPAGIKEGIILKTKLMSLQRTVRKNIRDLYRGINEFESGIIF
jgi:hypothetical protein